MNSEKVPREIRYCKCGCGETFTCKVSSSKQYIGHHSAIKTAIEDRVQKLCKYCGVKFEVPSYLGQKRIYCSLECYHSNRPADSARAKQSAGVKKAHQDGKYDNAGKKSSVVLKEGYRTGRIKPRKFSAEVLARLSCISKESWKNPVRRNACIEAMRLKWTDADYKRSTGAKIKVSLNRKERQEMMRKKYWDNPEWQEHQRVAMQKKWATDPEFREMFRKSVLSGRKPTSYEIKLIALFEEKRLPYKYVGDFQYWIKGKNPDFIHSGGRPIVIEVYSRYHLGRWKPIDYEVIRRCHFESCGYTTIFITEDELKKPNWKDLVLNKLRSVEEKV